jgi:hypothetical protein
MTQTLYAHMNIIKKEKKEKEWNYVICWKMDGTGDHHVKWNKAVPQRQVSHIFSHL